jgi:taurine-pyruvate aminotransferase
LSSVPDSATWTEADRRHVWHQMSGRPAEGAAGPLIISEGDGAWVTDIEGRRYLDGMSGQWCVNAGYGRDDLVQAVAEQLSKLAFYPLSRSHPPAIALSERLDGLLGGDRACLYSNSGSEEN